MNLTPPILPPLSITLFLTPLLTRPPKEIGTGGRERGRIFIFKG